MAKKSIVRTIEEVHKGENWGKLDLTVFHIIGRWYVADYRIATFECDSIADDGETELDKYGASKDDYVECKAEEEKKLAEFGQALAHVELYGFEGNTTFDFFEGIGKAVIEGRPEMGISATSAILAKCGLKDFGNFPTVLYGWIADRSKSVKATNSGNKMDKNGNVTKKATLVKDASTISAVKRNAVKAFRAFLYDGINWAFPTALSKGEYTAPECMKH